MSRNAEGKRAAVWSQFVRFSLFLFLLEFTSLISACGTPSKLSLTFTSTNPTESIPTTSNPIPMTVRIVKLVDVSPPEDKEDGWIYGSGWSVTAPERLNGDLAVILTKAVAENMRSHAVFKDLIQNQQNERMLLGGKIHKFYQRRENYLWGLCCGLLGILLPFPLMKEEGEVDLELTLSGIEENSLKSYRGKSSFLKRCNAYERRCWESYNDSPIKYLNEAFDDSLKQIRQAIINDRSSLLTSSQQRNLP